MNLNLKMDEVDKRILLYLSQDARKPFTEIAKDLTVSPGTIHVRVKKLEQMGVIKGASLQVDYAKLGYTFVAYIGIYLSRSGLAPHVVEELRSIPEVTLAHLATGKYGIFCKVRCIDAQHAKDLIFRINNIDGVVNTETMISLEECINSNGKLMENIVNNT